MPPPRPRARRAGLGLPPVTRGILVVTVLTYFLQGSVGDLLVHHSGLVARGEFWRIFTTALLHASFTHIALNMWALYVLGPQVERGVGSKAFLALYLASAGMGVSPPNCSHPAFSPAVGASGRYSACSACGSTWRCGAATPAWGGRSSASSA